MTFDKRVTVQNRFLIWGAGGHGKVVADIIRAQFGDVLIAYVDRDPARVGDVCEPGGGTIELVEEDLREKMEGQLDEKLVLAVGNNRARLEFFARARASGADMPVLIHPTASVSPSAHVGAASQIVTGAIVHPGASIGNAVIVNTGAIVEHDCVVGDGCHISPGAILAGTVTLGARTWVGAGATVINNLTIGSDVTIGAGAVVIADVPDGATVVGVPARPTE